MPLPTFKTQDEVPEAFRSGYIERDGEWVPDVEDVEGIKKNREEIRTDLKKTKADLKALQDAQKQRESGMSAEQIAKRREEDEALTKPLEEKIAALTGKLRAKDLDGGVKRIMLDAGANPKRVDDLFTLTGSRYDLSDKDTPFLKDKPTTDLAKYVSEVVAQEYPEFFLSKQKGGDSFNGGAGSPSREEVAKLVTDNPGKLLEMGNRKTA